MATRDKTPDATPDTDATPQEPAGRPAWPADARVNAKTLAALLADPTDAAHGYGTGRKTTDKVVRSIARDAGQVDGSPLARFADDEYTPHAYSQAEADAIHAVRVGRGGRGGSTVTADAIRTNAKGGSK